MNVRQMLKLYIFEAKGFAVCGGHLPYSKVKERLNGGLDASACDRVAFRNDDL